MNNNEAPQARKPRPNYKNARNQHIWRNGYLEALEDMAHALADGGVAGAFQWIEDNGDDRLRQIVKEG